MVNHIHLLGSHAQGGAGSVHTHIAATYHAHDLAFVHRHFTAVDVAEIVKAHHAQEVRRLHDALQLTAGQIERLGQGGSRTDEDGIVFLLEDAVDVDVLAHDTVGNEGHAECLDFLYLLAHHLFGQAIFGNAEHEHATRLGLALEDGHIESLTGQIAGHRQSRRTRTDNGHLAAGLLRQTFPDKAHLHVEVGNETFEHADAYAFSLGVEYAMPLALFLVRAYPPADGRQVAALVDDRHGITHVSHRQLMDKRGYVVLDGTPLATGRILAVQATLGLVDGLLDGVSAHFIKFQALVCFHALNLICDLFC